MPTFIRMLAAMALATFGALHAEERTETTKLDVTYKTTAQGPLKLDLHYPAAPKEGDKFPLVLFTHGGGWAAGSTAASDRANCFTFLMGRWKRGLLLPLELNTGLPGRLTSDLRKAVHKRAVITGKSG